MTEPIPGTTTALDVGVTAWSAPNPFGEPTAFVMVHPSTAPDDGTFADAVEHLGLRRLDAGRDILPIGTDTLYASLKAMRVELCTPDRVWLSHQVTDEWTKNAIGRRYIVLVIGTAPLSGGADADAISAYLADRTSVYAALVKIRVRFDQG
ncbi:hypothetical protein [Dactylosporangium salmoneum]|uniref:DUF1795 domain-containing protein n=1 Tax=Dactylosporangium salmoneum TaxID=53361 RepID=A0ABP5UB02_9ACTN